MLGASSAAVSATPLASFREGLMGKTGRIGRE
jgi:hypothetical protein